MSRAQSALLVSGGALAAIVLAVALAGLVLRGGESATLPGVTVAGAEVGDMAEAQVRRHVEAIAQARGAHPVVVSGEAGTRVTTQGEAGLRVGVEEAVGAALRRGRWPITEQLAYLSSRLRGAELPVTLPVEVDEQAARTWASEVAEQLSRDPVDADLTVVAGDEPDIQVAQSRNGTQVDAEALSEQLIDTLGEDRPVELSAPEQPVQPDVVRNDLRAAQQRVQGLLAGAVTLTNPAGGEPVELTPRQLAAIVRVRTDVSRERGERLPVSVDPAALRAVAEEELEAADVPPVDAAVRLDGDEVVIDPDVDGAQVDVAATAGRLVRELADGQGPHPPHGAHADRDADDADGERTVVLAMDNVPADRTREDAEDLGIVEEVSTFTTTHPCCRNRVHNIHLMADEVRGVVIEPGERFSLNDHVGPRSTSRGYRLDHMIREGEFVDVAGGGVSQFATTLFNAAFFAGVNLAEFQPHSQYIPRYPLGREATISYGSIDLVIENDTDYGLLIDTSYTDTSITVSFWSTEHLEVETATSGRTQHSGEAFSVSFSRTITDPSGNTERETWSHYYQQ